MRYKATMELYLGFISSGSPEQRYAPLLQQEFYASEFHVLAPCDAKDGMMAPESFESSEVVDKVHTTLRL